MSSIVSNIVAMIEMDNLCATHKELVGLSDRISESPAMLRQVIILASENQFAALQRQWYSHGVNFCES